MQKFMYFNSLSLFYTVCGCHYVLPRVEVSGSTLFSLTFLQTNFSQSSCFVTNYSNRAYPILFCECSSEYFQVFAAPCVFLNSNT